jgi:hypothetical protein
VREHGGDLHNVSHAAHLWGIARSHGRRRCVGVARRRGGRAAVHGLLMLGIGVAVARLAEGLRRVRVVPHGGRVVRGRVDLAHGVLIGRRVIARATTGRLCRCTSTVALLFVWAVGHCAACR